MNTAHRKPLPGTALDYFDAHAAVDAIQAGAYAGLPYTSRVLAENLVRRCDPASLTACLTQLIERRRELKAPAAERLSHVPIAKVHRISATATDDVSGIEAGIKARRIDPAGVIAVLAKTEGNGLVNDFSREWHGREDELVDDAAARQLVVDGRRTGDPANAPLYAGESVGLVTRERSATDVVREMDAEAEKALRAVSRLLSS